MYWAQELANQNEDEDLKTEFSKIANALEANETKIIEELNEIQGNAMNIGGYYQPNDVLADAAMRPNSALNSII